MQRQLGYLLAANNITLIYGGGNKGIMGAVQCSLLEKMVSLLALPTASEWYRTQS